MTERMWRSHDLKPTYDIVIVGAGVHGLAIAYYLAKRGLTNVAVLDKGYLGGGASGGEGRGFTAIRHRQVSRVSGIRARAA